MTEGRSLPWLQDTFTDAVWGWWQVTYRDVRILGPENELVGTYNLTQHDLGVAANREELKQLLLAAARFEDTDQDRLLDAWERLHFGDQTPAPGEDPDHDGADNFTEFAFGTDPTDPASQRGFELTWTPAGAEGGGLEVTFGQRLGSALTYTVEVSDTCAPWHPVAAAAERVSPPANRADGTGTGWTTWRLPAGAEAPAHRFLRVTARRAAP